MKTQIINRRKNITEKRRLNRLRNENNNIDISNFFEIEIIRNEKKIMNLKMKLILIIFLKMKILENKND